jgi:flagellar basal body rod protein FlgG
LQPEWVKAEGYAMLYGLYLSATGVITSAYRQDVIANNLANSETTGFKRDLATFYQRPTADQENPLLAQFSSKMLDKIGGGTFASPTQADTTQGTLEPTGNNLDAGILGPGFFTVAGQDGQERLTRDGRFRIDRNGRLTLSTDQANPVLNSNGQPIVLDPTQPTRFDVTGRIYQGNQLAGQLGFVDITDPSKLTKQGGSLFGYDPANGLRPALGEIQDGFTERSNVDPAPELTQLMDAQRSLEANANMIHYQDQMLGDLVNTVGKVS